MYTYSNAQMEDLSTLEKGGGGRWLSHESEARTHQPAKSFHNPQKVNVIRRIWRSHGHVIREKVIESITEDEAFQVEIQLIEKYGLRTFGGLLTNQTFGGKGTSGHKDVRQQRAAQAGVQFKSFDLGMAKSA